VSGLIRDVTGYTVSTNYSALWDLCQKQSIVCLVDYQGVCVDVAHTLARVEPSGLYVEIAARGINYLSVWDGDRDAFLRQCERIGLQWLVPTAVGQ
jgi:hypothetical protein